MGLFLITGCAKDTGSSPSPQPSDPKSGNGEQGSSDPQALKIYDGHDQSLNKFQATNLGVGKVHFDFTYQPREFQKLILSYSTLKSYLIGCKDSDIAISFRLFHAGPDGSIDFSAYVELGSAPVLVKKGLQYVLRVGLNLRASCLGLAYNFGINESR